MLSAAFFSGGTPLAQAMIERRAERVVLESLNDTILHMASIREGRTAVIAVTDGWVLYRPDQSLTVLRKDPLTGKDEPIPGMPPPPRVGSGGTLTTKETRHGFEEERSTCERDRMTLAMMDDWQYFRDLLGEANRANVSFYPVDPRGLSAFDSPIGPERPPDLVTDHVNLRARNESLRMLADNTDGLALVDNNDLRKQLRRRTRAQRLPAPIVANASRAASACRCDAHAPWRALVDGLYARRARRWSRLPHAEYRR